MSNASSERTHMLQEGEREKRKGKEREDFPAVHSSELFVTNLQSKTHQLTRQQQQQQQTEQQQQQQWQPSLCINEWTVSSQHSMGFVSIYVYRVYGACAVEAERVDFN